MSAAGLGGNPGVAVGPGVGRSRCAMPLAVLGLASAVLFVPGCVHASVEPFQFVPPEPFVVATTRPDGSPCVELDLALRLPFPDGTRRKVIQGNEGAFSHFELDRYAWDFAMPEGSVVVAAAEGLVVEAVDTFTEGAPDQALRDRGNRIIIDHGGGRFTEYWHLQPGGAVVHAGEHVQQGQLIGSSGNTGFTAGPHLHFAVVNTRMQSVPACFADVAGGVPLQGQTVESHGGPILHQETPPPPSVLPADTFAVNGLVIGDGVPVRRIFGPFTVTGRVVERSARAVAFFMPHQRDGRICSVFGSVDATGAFQMAVDPEALGSLSGLVDFAVTRVAPDGSYTSPFTIVTMVERAAALDPLATCP